ncbi:GNAT family N-acetyltransferase [Anaerocolumna xylanovorans]|uniref:Acetyltransferase (GNAT) family protein n=1 Tax=Anaerocolumna xylanovorans DSM 12503 TaxID=1121345 RepID=A0A1M7YFG4_9FIRM|nr:GNAT family N-acetyltransferase [Anaerocolumna xylanovorans]SHO51384.1 Acetyltransferase (GNAT) family protein [Anaerocolumna xylanovorans DSM 12503]
MSNQNELNRITDILLSKESDFGELKRGAEEMYHFFSKIAMVTENAASKETIYLPKGKAIATYWAGVCVNEFMRTCTYLRGIYQAILDCRKHFSGTVHIFYAGCGPFGTLLVPFTTFFNSDEIKITFADINSHSLECLQRVIHELGIEEYVAGIIQDDLTEYKNKQDIPIHMMVTETMNSALQKEPQVAITGRLSPLIGEGGILIPEKVTISAALIDRAKEREYILGNAMGESFIHSLGTVFTLDKETGNIFEEKVIDVPEQLEGGYNVLCLMTDIQVYKEACLTYNQCSLTLPVRVLSIDWNNNEIMGIGFRYQISENPGFVHRCIKKKINAERIFIEEVKTAHKEILFHIFKDIHPELAVFESIPGGQTDMLLKHQFEQEQAHLGREYQNLERSIIILDGIPIGYVYVDMGAEIRLVEIGLLEGCRRKGIGSHVVGDILKKAKFQGKKVSLQVFWFNNAAYEFYKNMGFCMVHNNGPACEMLCQPI